MSTREVSLTKEHYENLPDTKSIYDEIEPEPFNELLDNSHYVQLLRMIWVAFKVATNHHRKNAVRSWGFSVMYMHSTGRTMRDIGYQFGVERQKISTHRKNFIELAKPYLEQASEITPEHIHRFIAHINGTEESSNEQILQFISEIEQFFTVLVYAPKSRTGNHEVAVDLLTPSVRRNQLLTTYGFPIESAKRIAAFFEFINLKEKTNDA